MREIIDCILFTKYAVTCVRWLKVRVSSFNDGIYFLSSTEYLVCKREL